MEYTEIPDMVCQKPIPPSFNTLDQAIASCTSNPECGGVQAYEGPDGFYLICDRLIPGFGSGATGYMKGNSNSYLEGH